MPAPAARLRTVSPPPARRRLATLAAGGATALSVALLPAAPALAGAAPAEPSGGTAGRAAAAAGCAIPSTRDLSVTKAVYGVGRELGVSAKVMLAGFEAGWVESHMNNLDCGDRDSVGVFQQRPSQGWGTVKQIRNVRYAARKFFVPAQAQEKACPRCSAGTIAQRVQKSDKPYRYDAAAKKAAALRDEVKGTYRGRYSVRDICGTTFRYLDAHDLTGGTVYLLWDGRSNCVTTIKNTRTGQKSPVKAYIDPAGPTKKTDSGSYAYYAGPATLKAPGCIRWGGSVGTSTFDSRSGHCGS